MGGGKNHSYLKFAEGKYQRIRRETHRPEIVGDI